MNHTILAIVAYISWIIVLLFALAAFRTGQGKSDQSKSLKFKSDGSDLSAFGERLTRAHANTVESFSFVGATLLLSVATSSSAITDPIAFVIVLARLGQSAVHLYSTSNSAIKLRFVFFITQVVLCIYVLVMLTLKFI